MVPYGQKLPKPYGQKQAPFATLPLSRPNVRRFCIACVPYPVRGPSLVPILREPRTGPPVPGFYGSSVPQSPVPPVRLTSTPPKYCALVRSMRDSLAHIERMKYCTAAVSWEERLVARRGLVFFIH